jgi:hypothetical protein
METKFPRNLFLLEDDFVNSTYQYIANTCNCIYVCPPGISMQLTKKFPYADCYQKKDAVLAGDVPPDDRYKLGTVDICGDGKENRFIINMYSQHGCGKPRQYEDFDSKAMRLLWFKTCLEQIRGSKDIREIAFPCGLGDPWDDYLAAIVAYATATPQVRVVIVRG